MFNRGKSGFAGALGKLFLCLLFTATTAAAQTPRLALFITEPIGISDGSQCLLKEALTAIPPQTSLILTENDVVAWSPTDARWTLDPQRFSESGIGHDMSSHCFVLTIDGETISSGLALWVYSGRLTGYPTLNIIPKDGTLILQLTQGNHRNIRLIHTQALDNVLGSKLNPSLTPER